MVQLNTKGRVAESRQLGGKKPPHLLSKSRTAAEQFQNVYYKVLEALLLVTLHAVNYSTFWLYRHLFLYDGLLFQAD